MKEAEVYISGQKRGMTPALKRALKRRQMIEPYIGHMKKTNRLDKNHLKGQIGDQINALMAAVGHNLLMIIRSILLCWAWIQKALEKTLYQYQRLYLQ